MLHALACLGALLLALTGAVSLVTAAVILGEAEKRGAEDHAAKSLFGLLCLIIGFSMLTTSIAMLRYLQ